MNRHRWEDLCMSDDPFAWDYDGGGDSDCILSDKMVTNRKGGTCHACKGPCEPQTRNRVRSEVYDGEFMRFRWCVHCCFAMAAASLGRESLIETRISLGNQDTPA